MLSRIFDLNDSIEEAEDELEDVEASQQEIIEQVEENFDSFADVPSELEEAFDKLEQRRIEVEGRISRFGDIIDEWGGSQWRLTELTAGSIARIQDTVGGEGPTATDAPAGIEPGEGAAMVEAARQSIVEVPEDAPDIPDYPWPLLEELFEAIEAINVRGEVTMGNSSLRERASL